MLQWKLDHINGDPLQWYKLISSSKLCRLAKLSYETQLLYFDTLVTGKTKPGIAQINNIGAMYKGALVKHEQKFGHTGLVGRKYLDKFSITTCFELAIIQSGEMEVKLTADFWRKQNLLGLSLAEGWETLFLDNEPNQNPRQVG